MVSKMHFRLNYYGMQNYPSESQSHNFIYKNPLNANEVSRQFYT